MNQDDSKRPTGYTDAIHEVLQKAAAALPRKEVLQNTDSDKLPYQFTFEQWQSAGAGFGTPTPVEGAASKCLHDWKFYQGLNFDDFYCTKCSQTRPLDPSR